MNESETGDTDQPKGFQGYYQQRDTIPDAELTAVGPGTACGEYLRRYWQPVAMSNELADLPKLVRLLGEDLVLFRDGRGETGLLHRHCAHRGASLEFGIVADRGLICCYHGWQYDVDGTLIKAGSEPLESPICKNVVQGAYPTHEHEGIIFAYLGPPDQKPVFPVYDTEVQPDTTAKTFSITTPCNWLQVYENTQDPIHVLHLHARSSGVQFGEASGVDQVIEYRDTPLGMINIQTRRVGDRAWARTVDSIFPNCNQTGAIWEEAEENKFLQRCSILRWVVPVDDVTTRTIGWRYFSERLDPRGQDRPDEVGKESIDFIGQTQGERSYEEAQRQPGDFEAQVSQRSIAIHANEHLATSDTGVARLRRMLRLRIRAVAAGEAPEQPNSHGLSTVATFCQDTVTDFVDNGTDERDQLRDYGRRVADALLDSVHLAPDEREAHVEARCRTMR